MSWVAVAASACFLLSIVAAAVSTILEAVVVFDRVSHASAIWGELEPLEWAMLAIADLGFAFWLAAGVPGRVRVLPACEKLPRSRPDREARDRLLNAGRWTVGL